MGSVLRMLEGEKNKDRSYENTGKQKAGTTLGTWLKSLEVKVELVPPRSGTQVSGLE